tara:strand:- start:272 stop:538 length:267 start_codon:yes stop_codon:yes gene_type:complete
MNKAVSIYKKIKNYNSKIIVDGDKSISIRSVMLASWGIGKSKITNLPDSEDVKSTINCLKKLGVQINKKKNTAKFLVMELIVLYIKKE